MSDFKSFTVNTDGAVNKIDMEKFQSTIIKKIPYNSPQQSICAPHKIKEFTLAVPFQG